MNKLRAAYSRSKLSQDRVGRLEALGFGWDPIAELWENRFSELVRFKEKHGHCNVPPGWSEFPKLGNWVNTQRASYRRGSLTEERHRRLEKIGFRF